MALGTNMAVRFPYPTDFTVTVELGVGETDLALADYAVVDGGANWQVGDVVPDLGWHSGQLSGASLTVLTVNDNGAILTFEVAGTGTAGLYTVALDAFDDVTGQPYTGWNTTNIAQYPFMFTNMTSGEYFNHNNYEQGGVVTEYVTYPNGALPDGESSSYTPGNGDPKTVTLGAKQGLIKVVRTADNPQRQVAQWEPKIVNGNGDPVGQTLRAEDISDRDRCEAVVDADGNHIFVWVTGTAEPGNRGSYGYCRPIDPMSMDWVTGDSDCPVGYKYAADAGNGDPGCIPFTFTQVDLAVTGEFLTLDEAEAACKAGGNFWNGYTNKCVEGAAPAKLSLVGSTPGTDCLDFTTTNPVGSLPGGTKRDYARNACRSMGHTWLEATETCVANPTWATYNGDQEDCTTYGGVYIAGVCYDPNDFGDGQNKAKPDAWKACGDCAWKGWEHDLDAGGKCPVCGSTNVGDAR